MKACTTTISGYVNSLPQHIIIRACQDVPKYFDYMHFQRANIINSMMAFQSKKAKKRIQATDPLPTQLNTPSPLTHLPQELIEGIFKYVPDTRSASALSRTCRSMYAIFQTRGNHICYSILAFEMPNAKQAIQLYETQESIFQAKPPEREIEASIGIWAFVGNFSRPPKDLLHRRIWATRENYRAAMQAFRCYRSHSFDVNEGIFRRAWFNAMIFSTALIPHASDTSYTAALLRHLDILEFKQMYEVMHYCHWATFFPKRGARGLGGTAEPTQDGSRTSRKRRMVYEKWTTGLSGPGLAISRNAPPAW